MPKRARGQVKGDGVHKRFRLPTEAWRETIRKALPDAPLSLASRAPTDGIFILLKGTHRFVGIRYLRVALFPTR